MTNTSAGTRVVRYAEIASTNAEAMRLATAGESGPLWVVADVQTAGRGRSGRDWISQPGNLLSSYLFVTAAPIAMAHQLSLVAGVAIFEAVARLGVGREQGLRLKWPNDVLIGAAKAGGILVESSTVPGRAGLTAVVGIGLNLASHPEIAGREVTSMAAQRIEVTPESALDALDGALMASLAVWQDGNGFAAVRAAWLERAGPLGEGLRVQTPQGSVSGAFAGIDSDGALLLDLEGGERRRCTYGDVTLT